MIDRAFRGHRIRPPRRAALAALIALLLAQACATSPPVRPPPALPAPLDVATLVSPAPAPLVVPAHIPRYPDVRVRKGDCPGLPAGILVSPAVYAELHDEVSQRKRLAGELAAMGKLRAAERAAAQGLERAYRQRVAELAQYEGLTWKVAAALLAVGVVGLVGGAILAGGRSAR